MLDKKDRKDVRDIVVDSIGQFFEEILGPYLDEKFSGIDKRFASVDKRFDENDNEHDKILRKLEGNQQEHDRMFEQLDSIEGQLKDHEKRIKKREVITSS